MFLYDNLCIGSNECLRPLFVNEFYAVLWAAKNKLISRFFAVITSLYGLAFQID